MVFAGETFTQCPITLDHLLLKTLVDDADNWQLEDGTAMGDGLFMAVNRLADTTQLNTKVVILLTDGVRTASEFSPLDAANAAAQLNIRVYTIGVGSKAMHLFRWLTRTDGTSMISIRGSHLMKNHCSR